MRCKRCKAKMRTFIVMWDYKAYTCPKCFNMQAYTPWGFNHGYGG